MEITKRRLKQMIKEEMDLLATTGDIQSITESEKRLFSLILKKLTHSQLEDLGLKRI